MTWQRVFVGLSLAINCILLYSLIWGDQGLRAYRNLKEQHYFLEMRIKELDERNVALSKEIRLLQSDEKYQEKVIRQRFNFVRDNEILYIFPATNEGANKRTNGAANGAAKTGAGLHESKD